MTTVQNLTIIQRENLLKMIFNLTYGLDDDEMEALKGPSINYVDDKMGKRIYLVGYSGPVSPALNNPLQELRNSFCFGCRLHNIICRKTGRQN